MRVCPKCETRYADGTQSCSLDGRRLVAPEVLEESGYDPLLGTTLDGRFTIVGRVGAGGMGTVYRAEQAPMGRMVALKVLRRDLGRDPETVARFQREARALSQLKHPNTVTVHDFGHTDDGLLYLAMELLEGETLAARIKRDGALDVEAAIRTAAGVLRSLDEAHAQGIIHRDLKPDNIFLARMHGRPAEDEMAKVVDFGIAKIQHGEHAPGLDPLRTQEGTVFGTPRYMSPEQAQGRALDGRSDLYAVGVLLFHMLTGTAPFTDDDAVIVMAHHIKTVPEPVRRVAPGRPIPESLERLVARALAKSPDERPQTAADFLTALEDTADDAHQLRAATPPPAETTVAITARLPRARRSVAALALGAAGVVALVAASGWLSARRDAPATAAVRPSAVHATALPPAPPAPAPSALAEPAPTTPAAPAPDLAAVAAGHARRVLANGRGRRRGGRDAGVAPMPTPTPAPAATQGTPQFPRWED